MLEALPLSLSNHREKSRRKAEQKKKIIKIIVAGDHWLGLEILHLLTRDENYTLIIETWDTDDLYRIARYDDFKIGPESGKTLEQSF